MAPSFQRRLVIDSTTQICTREVRVAEACAGQLRLSEYARDKAGLLEPGPAQIGARKVGAIELCASQLRGGQASAAENSPLEIGARQVCPCQIELFEPRSTKVAPGELGRRPEGTRAGRVESFRPLRLSIIERAGQHRTREVDISQIAPAQIGRRANRARASEIEPLRPARALVIPGLTEVDP